MSALHAGEHARDQETADVQEGLQMNDYVLAQLNKLVVDCNVKLERIRALQRQTPSLIGNSNRQLALQKQARELESQVRTWKWLLAAAMHETDVVRFDDK
jgi:hypothetical protein